MPASCSYRPVPEEQVCMQRPSFATPSGAEQSQMATTIAASYSICQHWWCRRCRNKSASSIGSPRAALEGPGNVLRLHAEELGEAASARARRRSQQQTKSQHRKPPRQTNEQKQQQRQQVLGEGVNHLKHMLAGALSACVSKTIVAPLERVKMDCILKRRGISTAIVTLDIFRDEGILGFWHGNLLNVLRTAPYKVCLLVLGPYVKYLSSFLDTFDM